VRDYLISKGIKAEEILKGQFKRDCQVLVDRGGDDSLSFSIRVREEGEIKKSLKS
jgi:hypothetical protein